MDYVLYLFLILIFGFTAVFILTFISIKKAENKIKDQDDNFDEIEKINERTIKINLVALLITCAIFLAVFIVSYFNL